jgi:hypothetical protein
VLYAVMQLTPEPLSGEKLAQAFQASSRLTRADAMTLARNTYGILLEGLDLAEAQAIQKALQSQSVAVEAVPGEDIPVLPAPTKLHRADCELEALTVYDALNRPRRVEWSRVIVLAAGQVNQSEFKRMATQEYDYEEDKLGLSIPITQFATREERTYKPIIEMILEGSGVRYRIEAAGFFYGYLGARLNGDACLNFMSLLSDLRESCQQAGLNRGAASSCKDWEALCRYGSRQVFEREIRWLLWRRKRSRDRSSHEK